MGPALATCDLDSVTNDMAAYAAVGIDPSP
jgi:hypothetical protein